MVRWTIRESAFKPAIIQQSGLRPSHRVLDLGRGTGTLTRGIKKELAEAPVVGLDGDRKILGLEDFARIPNGCLKDVSYSLLPRPRIQD